MCMCAFPNLVDHTDYIGLESPRYARVPQRLRKRRLGRLRVRRCLSWDEPDPDNPVPFDKRLQRPRTCSRAATAAEGCGCSNSDRCRTAMPDSGEMSPTKPSRSGPT